MKWMSVVLAMVLVTGCKGFAPGPSDTDVMESWMGQPAQDLIMSWGPSDRTDPDGGGGCIYTWNEAVPPQYNSFNGTLLAPGYTKTYMFWAHSDGTLYHWQYRQR